MRKGRKYKKEAEIFKIKQWKSCPVDDVINKFKIGVAMLSLNKALWLVKISHGIWNIQWECIISAQFVTSTPGLPHASMGGILPRQSPELGTTFLSPNFQKYPKGYTSKLLQGHRDEENYGTIALWDFPGEVGLNLALGLVTSCCSH